jgi:hypothetical protein
LQTFAYAGTGNVLQIQELLHMCAEHPNGVPGAKKEGEEGAGKEGEGKEGGAAAAEGEEAKEGGADKEEDPLSTSHYQVRTPLLCLLSRVPFHTFPPFTFPLFTLSTEPSHCNINTPDPMSFLSSTFLLFPLLSSPVCSPLHHPHHPAPHPLITH